MKKLFLIPFLLFAFSSIAQVQYGPPPYNTVPGLGTDNGLAVRPLPESQYIADFSKVLASTWDPVRWTNISIGSGQAVSQAGGAGVMTTGTTINVETIQRSTTAFTGAHLLRAQIILSQRIVNQNFFVELVDVIGDGLVLTGVSATSCTVTVPGGIFASTDVGKSMNIGAISAGTIPGTLVPGRWTIASVSGNIVTFTVAGWTGATSGTGTCSLFGYNYHQLQYTSTTATSVNYDAQRLGWNSGATATTITTTASPGHMAILAAHNGQAFVNDQLVASTTTLPYTLRASRVMKLPLETTPLYLQIRSLNGTTAPASTTTLTVGQVSVENFSAQPVYLMGSMAQGPNTAQPVNVINTPNGGTINLLNTLTLLSGTTSLTPGTAATNLGKALGGAIGTADVGTLAIVKRPASDLPLTQNSAGQNIALIADPTGALYVKQIEKGWKTFSASANITLAAAATDVFTITGNATNTAYVTRIVISGVQTTAGNVEVLIVKRSTANTSGTSAGVTAIPHVAANSAVSTLLSYTANPTTGTPVGVAARREYVLFNTAVATTTTGKTEFNFQGQQMVLSGTAAVLAVNFNGATITGGVVNIWIEWAEQI